MNHSFANVPKAQIERSAFDRSHGYKTTFDAGYLVPIMLDEVLPGDQYKVSARILARLSAQVAPVMDNIYLDSFFFFVPSRLIWKNWERFNGAQDNPGDSTDYLIPQMVAPTGGFGIGSLADYFGIPTGVDGISVNALPFRAYNLVYDSWFRDENLQTSICSATTFGDGPDAAATYNNLLRRGKRHDYFTSSLPWPMKGPAVDLPIGTSAPVFGNGTLQLTDGTHFGWASGLYSDTVSPALGGVHANRTTRYGSALPVGTSLPQSTYPVGFDFRKSLGVTPEGPSGLYADLSAATAITINSLRQAFAIQRLYERDARGGTRYVEILKAHFGVTSPDARLQRPEYLGGHSQPVQINTVVQSSQTTTGASGSPQGNLSGYGVCSDSTWFNKSFVEHGFILGLVSVRTDMNYQQGLNRLWSRRSRFDFYWPALSHLGEQTVLNKEIFCQGPSVVDAQGNIVDDQPFGYQERFAEYRYCPSLITGKLRSTASDTLDYWHLAQKFTSLPTLGPDFIVENPPLARCQAVADEPQFIMDSWFNTICVRPMPTYSVPGMIDHF